MVAEVVSQKRPAGRQDMVSRLFRDRRLSVLVALSLVAHAAVVVCVRFGLGHPAVLALEALVWFQQVVVLGVLMADRRP